MADILRVVDVGNDATVYFDLNLPAGTGNPENLKTWLRSFDRGGSSRELGWFAASTRDGDTLVYQRVGRTTAGLVIGVEGSAGTFATLRAGVEKLNEVLNDPTDKRILWQPDGASARYINYHAADIIRLLRGQGEASIPLLEEGHDGELSLVLHVDPWDYTAPTTFISALTFGVDPVASVQGRTFTGTGNTKFPLDLTIFPVQAGSKVSEILVASRTRADVADLVATTGMAKLDASANTWTVALSNDTTAVDDTANGGVGSGARLLGTSTNVGVMLRRVRVTRTTLLDSLRGWERVFLRMRASAVSEWEVQLRWSPSLADPAGKTNTAVRSTLALGGSSGYVEKDLGYIMIPEEGALAGVALEIWARRIPGSGTGDLHMNFVRNLPATPDKDMITRIVAPAEGTETWLGSELVTPPYKLTADPTWTAGTVSGTDLVLDANNEAGGVSPNTGLAWPAGRHHVTFHVSTHLTSADVAKVRVVSVGGGGAGSEVVSQQLLTFDGPGVETRVLRFDSVGGTSYQPQVNAVSGLSAGDKVVVHSITHEFVPVLGQNEQAHTEPDSGIIHKRASSGNLLGILGTEGEVPCLCPPGLTAVFIVPLDASKVGYTEPESVKARTVTVTASGSPRFLG